MPHTQSAEEAPSIERERQAKGVDQKKEEEEAELFAIPSFLSLSFHLLSLTL